VNKAPELTGGSGLDGSRTIHTQNAPSRSMCGGDVRVAGRRCLLLVEGPFRILRLEAAIHGLVCPIFLAHLFSPPLQGACRSSWQCKFATIILLLHTALSHSSRRCTLLSPILPDRAHHTQHRAMRDHVPRSYRGVCSGAQGRNREHSSGNPAEKPQRSVVHQTRTGESGLVRRALAGDTSPGFIAGMPSAANMLNSCRESFNGRGE
jgi:hypothetical protein